MDAPEEHEGTVPPGRSRDDADDVRLKYLEARHHEHTFQGMVLARHVAEAVSDALEAELPEVERKVYQTKDLHGRLGFLEDKARKKEVDVSRAVLAALRTLQAYGNYASHHEAGTHKPPPRATTSAMASLALVVDWFQRRDLETPSTRGTELPLREPPPQPPSLSERWALVFGVDFDLPTLDGERFKLFSSDPPQTQLGTLYAYYGKSAEVCTVVCRLVLGRETTLDPEKMALEQLSAHLSQLSEVRPERVPRSVCASVEEVERRLASVRKAMQQPAPDVAPFVLEARQPSRAEDVVVWFRRDYLGQGWLQRRWRAVFLALVGFFVVWVAYEVGLMEGKRLEGHRLRDVLLAEFCDAASAPPSPRLCERLRDLAPAASAKAGVPAPVAR